MPRQLGVHQHDAAHCSILIDGRFLYINTSNGLNSKHTGVAAPDAPSLIVLDKVTGKLVARDRENIGQNIFHSTWSSPALGVINNKKYIIFGGGDGILYTFNALSDNQPDQTLNKVWWYDGDPAAPKTNVHEYIRNRRESPSNIKSMPVFHNSRVYLTLGGDIWWGKRKSWLKCIRASGEGNITSKNEIWSVPLEKHCCSTPSVSNGLVFVADCGGNIHCIDAHSGELYWSHETVGAIWASTLVADGNVYVGTIRGDFFSLKADKTKQLLCHVKMDDPIYSTAVAANNVLYIATLKALYALSNQN
jgi:hypothetical protein